jgi:benzoyl-CoA 2,3-dioxygenase component A
MSVSASGEETIRQHLIDPEICIRCNTCEATCPVGAVTHDERNYVVRADVCNFCMACVPPCPTGAIDNWRFVRPGEAYPIEEQLRWDELPVALQADATRPEVPAAASAPSAAGLSSAAFGASLPPWSAAHAYTNLYGPQAPTTATVAGNMTVCEAGAASDTRHIVLDFGKVPFPVLEGQSIGILAPGKDGSGRAHHARQYSVASARNGERPGYNNVALTVKRVEVDYQGRSVRGVCSNYLCDLKVGDTVQVIGPFGSTFLMPNHPGSNVVMICTGTGSAPMRAMTEWRRRLRASGKFAGGRLMLFFGARTREELPYFGPLMNLPRDFIDVNLAFSRTPGQARTYVQDLMRARATDLAPLLVSPDTFLYVCGLKSMEDGVIEALKVVAEGAGHDWSAVAESLRRDARLHLETY